MSWTAWPPTNNTTDIQKYDFIIQLWKALRERSMAALGDAYYRWPRSNIVYGEGTITAMSTTTMTDGTQAWSTSPKRWVGWGSPSMNFDLIVNADAEDQTKVVNAGRISDNSATVLTLNTQAVADAVTAKVISGTAYLVGTKYAIIEQGGIWWSERWLNWPNDHETYAGTLTSSSVTTLTDSTASWEVDEFNSAYELIVRDDAGVLRRLDITDTSADTLTFSSITPNYPVGDYKIIATGNKCLLAQVPGKPFQWFNGATTQYDARGADGVLTDGSVESVPCATYGHFSTGDGVTCVDSGEPADPIDTDVWSGYDELCSHPDTCYTPDIFKSLRMLQATIEGLCTHYVESKTYDGAAAIPYFNPATLFKKAGINYIGTFTASVSSGSVTLTISGLPFTPIDVFYSLQRSTGEVIQSGTLNTDSTETFTGLSAYNGETLSLVVSLGWTRTYPRRFRYRYARTAFSPDLNAGSPVEPGDAEATYCGEWETRAASTAYMEYDSKGFAADGGASFTNGDAARYVGDNAGDPGINPHVQGSVSSKYYDYFTVTRLNLATQADWDAGMSGTATSGNTTCLFDTGKNWWGDPYGEGVMRNETGTATSGSSTTQLKDTSKAGNIFWDTATGRWAGFMLEMTSGVNAGFRRPISAFSGTTITVSPAFPSAIGTGDAYRIREPKFMLNRWKGRTITITKPGATAITTIAYSDDVSIWFASPIAFVVDSTCSYRINEDRIGFVYERTAGAWVLSAGETKSIPTERPDHVTRYGRLMKGDVITSDLLTEIYDAINELVWTKKGIAWKARANDATPENNVQNTDSSMAAYTVSDANADYAASVADAETDYSGTGATHESEEDDAPYAYFTGSKGPPDTVIANFKRRYAYAEVSDVPTLKTSNAEYYNYSSIRDSQRTDITSGDLQYRWDANGDDVIQNAWSLWDSDSGTDATRKSIALGNTSLPRPTTGPAPDDIAWPDPPTFTTSQQGYTVLDACAILKWDVSGGFTYVP